MPTVAGGYWLLVSAAAHSALGDFKAIIIKFKEQDMKGKTFIM
jgi:hypothetical protein